MIVVGLGRHGQFAQARFHTRLGDIAPEGESALMDNLVNLRYGVVDVKRRACIAMPSPRRFEPRLEGHDMLCQRHVDADKLTVDQAEVCKLAKCALTVSRRSAIPTLCRTVRPAVSSWRFPPVSACGPEDGRGSPDTSAR